MMLGARTAAWEKSGSPVHPAYGGLRFTAESANSSVQLTAVGSAPTVTLVKSYDGVNWEDYTVGEFIELPSIGDSVYLAAGEGGNETLEYHNFIIEGLVSSSGDITSLRRFDLIQTTLSPSCYRSMFQGCTGLTSAPELPATTLSPSCYRSMFQGCTGLTSAPELPATTLSTQCYRSMFQDCTGLTSAPELPATTLSVACYYSMFQDCTGLTSAPELPATTLSPSCYRLMFQGCTGLTSAPELPATTLSAKCYRSMFQGCTGLTSAELLATTINKADCCVSMFLNCSNLSLIKVHFTTPWSTYTGEWLDGVSALGIFYKPSVLTESYGTGKIPTGWTVVNID